MLQLPLTFPFISNSNIIGIRFNEFPSLLSVPNPMIMIPAPNIINIVPNQAQNNLGFRNLI